MVSMKTVLCHDYTGKIFIPPKILACGGWAVVERVEHASLQREMWPQAAVASALAKVREDKQGLRLVRLPNVM